jgi:hypothetical protein
LRTNVPRQQRRGLPHGKGLNDLIYKVPDEFFQWVTQTSNRLNGRFNTIRNFAEAEYNELINHLSLGGITRPLTADERKAFAEGAKQSENPGLLFAMLDDKPTAPLIWRMVRPHGGRAFKTDIDV